MLTKTREIVRRIMGPSVSIESVYDLKMKIKNKFSIY